jgi:hypothetical protein
MIVDTRNPKRRTKAQAHVAPLPIAPIARTSKPGPRRREPEEIDPEPRPQPKHGSRRTTARQADKRYRWSAERREECHTGVRAMSDKVMDNELKPLLAAIA